MSAKQTGDFAALLSASLATIKAGRTPGDIAPGLVEDFLPASASASPRITAAVRAALAAVRRAHPRLRGRFVASWLPCAPRSVWLRYYTPSNSTGEATLQWLYRADADPALVELV
jgi:hypothetical protein